MSRIKQHPHRPNSSVPGILDISSALYSGHDQALSDAHSDFRIEIEPKSRPTGGNPDPRINRGSIRRLMGTPDPMSPPGDYLATDGVYADVIVVNANASTTLPPLQKQPYQRTHSSIIPPLVSEGIGRSVVKCVAIAMQDSSEGDAANEIGPSEIITSGSSLSPVTSFHIPPRVTQAAELSTMVPLGWVVG